MDCFAFARNDGEGGLLRRQVALQRRYEVMACRHCERLKASWQSINKNIRVVLFLSANRIPLQILIF